MNYASLLLMYIVFIEMFLVNKMYWNELFPAVLVVLALSIISLDIAFHKDGFWE